MPDMDPVGWLDPEKRAAFRARCREGIPEGYSGWAHLGATSAIGLGLVGAAVASIRALRPWDLAVVPAVFVLSNAIEWRAHKNVLHRRVPILSTLYERHTPIHHRYFVTDDMSVEDHRGWRLVLIPPVGIAAVAVITAPITLALALAGMRNKAALFVATSVAYVVLYEWLHLAYHLAPDNPIGGLSVIRWLRRHHATHHDPTLMQRWNFNVTVPLWDLVRGTYHTA